MSARPPNNFPLAVGERFTIRTGRRRLLYPGDLSYFQRQQRRYFCRVVTSENERYRDGWQRPETRCLCEVEVVAI
jgi:hypothetical protein